MKKIILFLIIAVISVTVCACATAPSNNDAPEINTEDTLEIYFPSKDDDIGVQLASIDGCENTAELYNKSVGVIVGTVMTDGKIALEESRSPVVMSTVKIEKVINGDFEVGETINIHESGDIIDGKEYAIAGVPLLKKKMKVLLYLIGPTDYYIGEDSYGINGVYQGKFFYDNNGTVHSAIAFSKEQEPIYLTDFKEPMKEAAVMTAIDAVKDQQAVK